MVAARDQAARALRTDDEVQPQPAHDASPALADQLRTHGADEARRKPGEAPASPAVEKPAAAPGVRGADAPARKSGKRRFMLVGLLALLALAAPGYAAYYVLVGRFFVSTDD